MFVGNDLGGNGRSACPALVFAPEGYGVWGIPSNAERVRELLPRRLITAATGTRTTALVQHKTKPIRSQ
jgi:hypothetical protein